MLKSAENGVISAQILARERYVAGAFGPAGAVEDDKLNSKFKRAAPMGRVAHNLSCGSEGATSMLLSGFKPP